MGVLKNSVQHDFHHLPEYHALSEAHGEGCAYLFVYEEAPYFIAVPLLLRPAAAVSGLEQAGQGWLDATSVYGYSGPITSHTDIPACVLSNFKDAFRQDLVERHVVNLFSRLHPLIPQGALLADLGERVAIGQTVSIDLSAPADRQFSLFRTNHKRGIAKLTASGVTCTRDAGLVYLADFVDIYLETMRRVSANAFYLFDADYVERFVEALAETVHLFVCTLNGHVIAGGLFTLTDGIVQYHLGGTRNDYLKLSPMKVIFDRVRLWANERGAHVFHLGGGLSAQEDSLFHFKAGFSDRRHECAVWRWVLLPDVYRDLCEIKTTWNMRNGRDMAGSDYFPLYRDPIEWKPAPVDNVVNNEDASSTPSTPSAVRSSSI